ncbi:MAG TPA: polysaccharide deacetylase family protein [Gaiellaceae bacterium]|nr:polysaccharide deacetylase family protein [Gaiellaceae bacterium]
MRAYRAMQVLKNGLYRTTGEAVSAVSPPDDAGRTLRVLMYHKVNDQWPNPITVPTAVFDEQMTLLRELGYRVVSLRDVRDHYLDGATLPDRAVLITFDDGYLDNLEQAAPILVDHGYPAVIFAPIGYLDPGARPLPHEESLLRSGIRNPTLTWSRLKELDDVGIRIESHGIGHRRLAELDPDEALREIAISKIRLEEALGREVEAYAYVKGSRADYRAEHASLVRQAGYKLGFSAVSGVNDSGSDRYQLLRYNVEPYSARTFELVLTGSCDLLSLKDTVPGTHARRTLTRLLGIASR